MGSRAADKLTEIENLRNSLGDKLGELERRFPLAGFGRRAAAMVAGGSAGGTALAFMFRRLRRGRRRPKTKEAASAPVVVNVIPKGASWIAAIGVAAWAGARIYDIYTRSRTDTADGTRAVVTPIPDASRRSGAGS